MATSGDKAGELYEAITKINEKLALIGADAEFFSNAQSGRVLPANFMDRAEFKTRLDMLEDHLAKYTAAEAHEKNVIDQVTAGIDALSSQNPLLIQEDSRHMIRRLETRKEEAERKLAEASCAAFRQKLAIHHHWANYKPIDAAEFRKTCSALIDEKIAAYKAVDGRY